MLVSTASLVSITLFFFYNVSIFLQNPTVISLIISYIFLIPQITTVTMFFLGEIIKSLSNIERLMYNIDN